MGRSRAECTLPAPRHEGRAGAPAPAATSFPLLRVPPLTLKGIFSYFRFRVSGPPPCIPALHSLNHTPPKSLADQQRPPEPTSWGAQTPQFRTAASDAHTRLGPAQRPPQPAPHTSGRFSQAGKKCWKGPGIPPCLFQGGQPWVAAPWPRNGSSAPPPTSPATATATVPLPLPPRPVAVVAGPSALRQDPAVISPVASSPRTLPPPKPPTTRAPQAP